MPESAWIERARGLCRGTNPLAVEAAHARAAGFDAIVLIVLGGAAFGGAMGAWRSPQLAAYVAIKLPLLLFATAIVDALLNGLWAKRLGFDLSLRESLRAVLLSFALASVVLGSLAPVVLLFDLALPGP